MKYFLLFLFICTTQYATSQEETRYTEEEISAIDSYMAAQVEIYKERYDLAIPMLMDLHKKDRQNAIITFDLAKAYEATEDYSSADKYASMTIRLRPDDIWMRLYYGKLMIKMEKYYEAADAFSILVKKDPEDFSHIENYGKCLIKTGENRKAIEELDKWEEEYGIHEPVSRLKFQIHNDQKDKKKAEKELIKLVDHTPYNTRYLNNLASFYINNDSQDKAKDIYQRILDIDPNDKKANTAMITLTADDKKDGPFLRTLIPLIERQDIDPDLKIKELIPYVNQLTEENNPEIASSLLELTKSLSLIHPDNAKCQAIYGDVLQLSGNTKDAIKAYEKTLQFDDNNYLVWQQLMYALLEENNYQKLSTISYQAIDLFPNKADAYFFYGISENESENTVEALNILQEGLMISANNLSIKSNILAEIARSQFINGNIDKAEQSANQSLELSNNKNPFALEVKGDIYASSGNRSQAIEMWKKAVEFGSTRSSLRQKLNQ